MATEGSVNEQRCLQCENRSAVFSPSRLQGSRFLAQVVPRQAERPRRPSAFSDFGSEGGVLLANGLVVVQNPLQVSHSFTTVFSLNLWTIQDAIDKYFHVQENAAAFKQYFCGNTTGPVHKYQANQVSGYE